MNLIYPTPLDPAQIEQLLTTGELWVPCPNVPCPNIECGDVRVGPCPRCGNRNAPRAAVPDPVWAAAKPCDGCDGVGEWIEPVILADGTQSEIPTICVWCNGGRRKRIELRVPCQCDPDEFSHYCGSDGTILAATASVAEVGRVSACGWDHGVMDLLVIDGRSIYPPPALPFRVGLTDSWLMRLTNGQRA